MGVSTISSQLQEGLRLFAQHASQAVTLASEAFSSASNHDEIGDSLLLTQDSVLQEGANKTSYQGIEEDHFLRGPGSVQFSASLRPLASKLFSYQKKSPPSQAEKNSLKELRDDSEISLEKSGSYQSAILLAEVLAIGGMAALGTLAVNKLIRLGQNKISQRQQKRVQNFFFEKLIKPMRLLSASSWRVRSAQQTYENASETMNLLNQVFGERACEFLFNPKLLKNEENWRFVEEQLRQMAQRAGIIIGDSYDFQELRAELIEGLGFFKQETLASHPEYLYFLIPWISDERDRALFFKGATISFEALTTRPRGDFVAAILEIRLMPALPQEIAFLKRKNMQAILRVAFREQTWLSLRDYADVLSYSVSDLYRALYHDVPIAHAYRTYIPRNHWQRLTNLSEVLFASMERVLNRGPKSIEDFDEIMQHFGLKTSEDLIAGRISIREFEDNVRLAARFMKLDAHLVDQGISRLHLFLTEFARMHQALAAYEKNPNLKNLIVFAKSLQINQSTPLTEIVRDLFNGSFNTSTGMLLSRYLASEYKNQGYSFSIRELKASELEALKSLVELTTFYRATGSLIKDKDYESYLQVMLLGSESTIETQRNLLLAGSPEAIDTWEREMSAKLTAAFRRFDQFVRIHPEIAELLDQNLKAALVEPGRREKVKEYILSACRSFPKKYREYYLASFEQSFSSPGEFILRLTCLGFSEERLIEKLSRSYSDFLNYIQEEANKFNDYHGSFAYIASFLDSKSGTLLAKQLVDFARLEYLRRLLHEDDKQKASNLDSEAIFETCAVLMAGDYEDEAALIAAKRKVIIAFANAHPDQLIGLTPDLARAQESNLIGLGDKLMLLKREARERLRSMGGSNLVSTTRGVVFLSLGSQQRSSRILRVVR